MRDYIWADNTPIAMITKDPTTGAETVTYLHTDYDDTPRMATNQSGTILWRWEGVFGNTLLGPPSPVDVTLRYPGQTYDSETGLFYNWNRYYDPTTGRYDQSDLAGLEGGLNTYTYVLNNPLIFFDQFGLHWQFVQHTGKWNYVNNQTDTVTPVGQGYSGTGAGLNNPNMQDVPNVGPIPQGPYNIGPGHFSPTTGPDTMNLDPLPGTNTYGRDLFRIHGDNASHNASHGCPIAPPNVRQQINNSNDHVLVVVP